MSKLVKLLIVTLVSTILFTGCSCSKNDDEKAKTDKTNTEEKYNTNQGIIENKELNGLIFTNTSLKTESNSSTLITSVTNTTTETINVRIFNIIIKDSEGNTIVTLQGYVGGEIPAGDTRKVTSNVDVNLKNASTIEYELVQD